MDTRTPSELIRGIRSFNRSYTNKLGLLSKYRFDGDYTLAEARILLEIGEAEGSTSARLLKILRIDPGYLSRILSRFERAGLVEFGRDGVDARKRLLKLTEGGKKELQGIHEKSDDQVEAILAHLCERDRESLFRHMEEAERLIGKVEADGIEMKFLSSRGSMVKAAELFREYFSFLGVDLSFQGFEEELAGLPGHYAPPGGAILAAFDGNDAAGCVALRPMAIEICEMKRLYVRPGYRGLKIGKRLAEGILREAARIGYTKMRLDTLERLKEACALYRNLGFKEIAPYYENPLPGVVYFETNLLEQKYPTCP